MRINHNIAALNTYRQLSTNSANTSKALEKLSSGLRINRAGDDAAGLAISEKMRAQIRGLDQAGRNAQDGISLLQTAEGALNETHSILQRMRELANQAANDTNVNVDREEIQNEINQLTSEINRIGNTTEFNTQSLLNGSIAITGDGKTVRDDFAGQGGLAKAIVDPNASADVGTYTVSVKENINAKMVQSSSDITDASVNQGDKVELDSGLYKIVINQKEGKVISAIDDSTDDELLNTENNNSPISIHTNSSLAAADYTINVLKERIAQDFSSDIGVALEDVNNMASGDYTIKTSRVFVDAANDITDDGAAGTGLVADGVISNFRVANDASASDIASINTLGASIDVNMAAGTTDGQLVITFSDGTNSVDVTVTDSSSGARAIKLGAVEFDVDVAAIVEGVDFGDGSVAVDFSGSTYDTGELDIATGAIHDQVSVTYKGETVIKSTESDNSATPAQLEFDFLNGSTFDIDVTTEGFVAGKSENINVQSQYTITMDDGTDPVGNEVVLKANNISSNADVQNIDLGKGVYVDFDLDALTAASVDASAYTIDFTVGTDTTNVAEIIDADTGARVDGTLAQSLDNVADSSAATTINLGKGIELTYTKDSLDAITDLDDRAILFAVAKEASDFDITLTDSDGNAETKNILAGQDAIFTNGISVETDENLSKDDTVQINIENTLVDNSLQMQIGANHGQSMSMDISDMRSAAINVSGGEGQAGQTVKAKSGAVASYTTTKDVTDGTTSKGEEYALDVSTHDKASAAVDVINDAIEKVSKERSKLGAFQNRLEHTINNLGTSSENLTSAESRVRDVDMAKEMMEFTKNNILSQAAQAMLAQANQQPQGVLQLLR